MKLLNMKFLNTDLKKDIKTILGWDSLSIKKDAFESEETTYTIETNDNSYFYANEKDRDKDYNALRTIVALQKVVDYSYSDERKNLEEHLYDELGSDEADGCENLTDTELYDKYNEDVEHIWFHLYVVSELIPA